MVDALVYGTCFDALFMVQVEVQVDALWLIGWLEVLVQVVHSISHNDSVTVVPSFYFYVRAVGRGKDRWL
jgi:hypothetical protein